MSAKCAYLLAATAASTLAWSGMSQAATITWQAPTDVAGSADVNTTGTTLGAYTLGDNPNGGSTNTVNGVAFTPVGTSSNSTSSLQIGGNTLVPAGTTLTGYDSYGSPSSFNTAYQHLLTSGVYENNGGTNMTLTLGGLTVGQDYLIQLWVNDARPAGSSGSYSQRTEQMAAGNAVTLDYQTGTLSAGQYVIGTFKADGVSQAISLTAATSGSLSADGQLNAFQVRNLVPEPATLGLLAFGGLGLLLLPKRRTAIGSARG